MRAYIPIGGVVAVFGAVAAMPACSSSSSPAATSDAGVDSTGAPADAATNTAIKHIFLIMMENTAASQILGNSSAPYINSLATTYGQASNYYGVTHPSLPNYLAMFSGDFQGIWDDDPAGATSFAVPGDLEFQTTSGDPTSAVLLTPAQVTVETQIAHWFTGQNLVDQLETKGLSWKAYMQSMPSAGYTGTFAPIENVADGGTVAHRLYAQKHNPFMYFADVAGATDAGATNPRLANVVPFEQLATDLAAAGSTANFVWITPDQCHDMHGVHTVDATYAALPGCDDTNLWTGAQGAAVTDDALIQLGDDFVKATVTAIEASPAWSEGSVIAIAWDEDNYASTAGCCGSPSTGADGGLLGGGSALAIVVTSANAKAQVVNDPFNHYSLLGTIEAVWGLPCLANTCGMTGTQLMTKLFTP